MHLDFEGFRFDIDVENVYKYVVVGVLLKKRAIVLTLKGDNLVSMLKIWIVEVLWKMRSIILTLNGDDVGTDVHCLNKYVVVGALLQKRAINLSLKGSDLVLMWSI